MASKGTLTVRIIGDAKSFSGALGQMQGGLSSMLGPIGMVGGALAGLGVAAGTALFGIGQAFDDVGDKIRIGTGATGADLEGLMDDFRAIARDTPSTFDEIGTAVADLNTRLGLTGVPLQELSRQVLNLSRLTGADLGTVIPAMTRLMQDWSISSVDAADALDDVFVAAQATGITVDALAQNAVQFGSPLRQLGFSFSEVLAMFGLFEQQGVNIETVMSGLRQSIGRFARAGEDPAEALSRVVDEIKELDAAAANARAIEVFGARAGPDLAAAIQEGRFELGELIDTIDNSRESIGRASEDTADFGEAWQVFKNNILLALEEPATRVFTAISNVLQDTLLPAVQRVSAAFADGDWAAAWEQIQVEWDAIRPEVEEFMSEFGSALGEALGDALVRTLTNYVKNKLSDPETWLFGGLPGMGQILGFIEDKTGIDVTPGSVLDEPGQTGGEIAKPPPPSFEDTYHFGALERAASSTTTSAVSGASFNLTVNNPTSEPTEASVRRELQRVQLMAV